MSEYRTGFNGEVVVVYDFDKCIKALQCRNFDNEKRIKYLEEENRKLKEEYNKDEEIQKMKSEVEKMQKDYWRGFPITEDEENAIKEWRKKHDVEVHGLTTSRMRMKAEGCCGGRYSYKFVPTSISTIGYIECSCGEKFCFTEIE